MQFFNIAGVNVGIFAAVIAAAAMLGFGARQFGQTTVSDLSEGPKAIMRTGMVVSAFYATVITGLFWWFLAMCWSSQLAPPVALVAGMIVFVNSLTPSWTLAQNGAGLAATRIETARRSCEAVVALFDILDIRGRGELNEDDLHAALKNTQLTATQIAAVQFVIEKGDEIGRVSERSYTEERTIVCTSYGGFVSTVPEVVRHYTVSRDDLLSHPAKVAQQHQCWCPNL